MRVEHGVNRVLRLDSTALARLAHLIGEKRSEATGEQSFKRLREVTDYLAAIELEKQGFDSPSILGVTLGSPASTQRRHVRQFTRSRPSADGASAVGAMCVYGSMGYVGAYLCKWFDTFTLVVISAFSHSKLLRSNRELLEKSRDGHRKLDILFVSGRLTIVTLPVGRELSALTNGVMYAVLPTNRVLLDQDATQAMSVDAINGNAAVVFGVGVTVVLEASSENSNSLSPDQVA